jgi:methionyl-tRNA formyltransferase
VYRACRTAIRADETAGNLEERLGALAAEHIGECIWGVCRQGWTAAPQPAEGVTVARRLTKEDARIDWRRSACEIERMVRAYLPWPTAFTTMAVRGREVRVQITGAHVAVAEGTCGAPGEVIASPPSDLAVACGSGVLSVDRIVPAGRREMSAEEFLRGSPVSVGTLLGN